VKEYGGVFMPMTYKFPLKMHVGAPSIAIVKEGQMLKEGNNGKPRRMWG
jgi:hypothetical protein